MKKLSILFLSLLSLIIAKAQTNQGGGSEEQSYVPWFEVNYAQIAYENKAELNRSELKLNKQTKYEINNEYTYTFNWVLKEGNKIILEENIITAESENTVESHCTKEQMGICFSANHITGITDLKKSDKIEIAFYKHSINTTATSIISSYYNISKPQPAGKYFFNFIWESTPASIEYDVYTAIVANDGHVSFKFNQWTEVAYIKVFRLESVTPIYYLVGDMTKDEVNDWAPNPSYELKTIDAGKTYQLTVGSILEGQLFQIVNSDKTEWYGVKNSNEKATPVDYRGSEFSLDRYHLAVDNNTNYYDMTFDSTVINVLFTFSPGNDPKLSILGTAVNSESLIISPGNDQTMQSGVVDDDHIDLITVSDRAMVYIHVPESFNEDLYYMVVPNNGVQEIKSREGSNRVKANINDGYFTVGLALGSGSILVYADPESENPKQTFTYTVTKGIPTSIQLESAEETEAIYFNLQGVKITNPERGNLYIKVLNGKASKVIL